MIFVVDVFCSMQNSPFLFEQIEQLSNKQRRWGSRWGEVFANNRPRRRRMGVSAWSVCLSPLFPTMQGSAHQHHHLYCHIFHLFQPPPPDFSICATITISYNSHNAMQIIQLDVAVTLQIGNCHKGYWWCLCDSCHSSKKLAVTTFQLRKIA